MKGRRTRYSPAELAWIEAYKHLPRRELHQDFVRCFGRLDVSQSNLTALCKRHGWLTGRTGRFVKGQVSHNKGRKGVCAPGSEKGWFKQGTRSGRAKENYKPIGTERLSKSGYRERKIHDGMPLQSRWRAVHLIEWEAENGPVPDGHCLKCLDGDKTNCTPENWVLIPRSMLPRLSGRWSVPYDEAPDELKPTLLTVAKLEDTARKLKRNT
jgi:hypothetical protein